MKAKLLLFFFCLVPVLSASAQQQQHIFDKNLQSCLDENRLPEKVMDCFDESSEKWEKKIEFFKVQIEKSMSQEEAPEFYAAQDAWEIYWLAESQWLKTIQSDSTNLGWQMRASEKLQQGLRQRAMDLEIFYQKLR